MTAPHYPSHGRKGHRWRKLRQQVLDEDGTCYLCGAMATQVDHIIPRSVAPHLAHERSNLAAICARCNRAKGTKPLSKVRPRRASPRWS